MPSIAGMATSRNTTSNRLACSSRSAVSASGAVSTSSTPGEADSRRRSSSSAGATSSTASTRDPTREGLTHHPGPEARHPQHDTGPLVRRRFDDEPVAGPEDRPEPPVDVDQPEMPRPPAPGQHVGGIGGVHPRPVVLDGDHALAPLSLARHLHEPATAGRLDAVAHGVLDERLQREVGHRDGQDLRRDPHLHPQLLTVHGAGPARGRPRWPRTRPPPSCSHRGGPGCGGCRRRSPASGRAPARDRTRRTRRSS